jgi:hypothetical protein
MKAKASKRERPYEKFVREYMAGFAAGEDKREIAKRLDTTPATVEVCASRLRGIGVRLPMFTDRLDVEFLNRIVTKAKRKSGVKLWAR